MVAVHSSTVTVVWDREFRELVTYFEALVSHSFIDRVVKSGTGGGRAHFWYKYLRSVERWQLGGRKISDVSSNLHLVELAQWIKAIQIFSKDWDTPNCRGEFVNRLRDDRQAPGLIFELTSGIHFLQRGLDVEWVGGSQRGDEPIPDLVVSLAGNDPVLVECTQKQPSFRRLLSDRLRSKELMKAAEKKLKSKLIWQHARIIVAKIPEEIDWSNSVQREFEKRTDEWFEQGRLGSVSGFYFLGGAGFKTGASSVIRGHKNIVKDQWALFLRNNAAIYPIPIRMRHLLSQM